MTHRPDKLNDEIEQGKGNKRYAFMINLTELLRKLKRKEKQDEEDIGECSGDPRILERFHYRTGKR